MDRFSLVIAALVGGILIALAGVWDAHEPWDWRKFGASVIRALFAGAIFAIGYPLSDGVGAKDLLYAFTSAVTTDVAINRIAGALGNGAWPLPAAKVSATPDAPTSPAAGPPPAGTPPPAG